MTKPLRIAALMQMNLTAPPGTMLPSDRDITTTCAACGKTQNLFEASVGIEFEGDTVYRCVSCSEMLAAVTGVTGQSRWTGRGANLNGRVIRSKSDLFIPVIGATKAKGVILPGFPDAFDRDTD